MTDVFPKEKRSEIMAAVRGRGNRSTEARFRDLLEKAQVSGWRESPNDVYGKPDFVFDQQRIAVFIDGCFWHGCDRCRNIPATNVEFWSKKINDTKARDETVNSTLTEIGWRVVRFWEHDLKKKHAEATLERLTSCLDG